MLYPTELRGLIGRGGRIWRPPLSAKLRGGSLRVGHPPRKTGAPIRRTLRGSLQILHDQENSGREDLNLRPLGPKPSALAKLSHAPLQIFIQSQIRLILTSFREYNYNEPCGCASTKKQPCNSSSNQIESAHPHETAPSHSRFLPDSFPVACCLSLARESMAPAPKGEAVSPSASPGKNRSSPGNTLPLFSALEGFCPLRHPPL